MKIDAYLRSDDVVDWRERSVAAEAARLAGDITDKTRIAERCFLFVRDEIDHSGDHRHNRVTCRASEVLEHRTGWCFAKSHLLAALLRANGVPAGLCYQRLSIEDSGPPYCLHGLNAVFLPSFGWYRVDSRGNKAGVDAQFSPPKEKLAYEPSGDEERDLSGVRVEPLPIVTDFLLSSASYVEAVKNLPDFP